MANTQLPARLLDTSAVPALNVTGDLTVDTTTLKVDTTNNRVGIGEPSPSGKLSIKSSGTSTYPLWIKASDGSNAFMLYEHGSGEIEIDLRKADGSSPKFKVSETGNLGIGIAAPTHRLHVLSTENKGFLLDRNTSNSPANLNEFSSYYSLSIKNRAGGSYLNFGGNGANTSIQATDGAGSATAKTISLNPYGGSVGIGTTSAGSYNANADDLVIFNNNVHAGITIAGGTDDYGNIYFAQGTSGSDAYRGYIQYGHSATTDASYRDVMLFGTATQERVRIDSSGNVGIGATPYFPLHVSGATGTNGEAKTNALFFDTTSATTGTGGGIALGGYSNGTGGDVYHFGNIQGIKENSTAGDYASAMLFSTRANGATPTEKMRIDSSGNVGIGTNSPSSFNALADNLVVGTTSGSNGISIVGATNGNSSIYFADGTSGAAQQLAGYVQYSHGSDALIFGSGGGNEAMRIDSSGNVGIGTSTNTSGGAMATPLTIAASSVGNGIELFRGANSKFEIYMSNNGIAYFNVDGNNYDSFRWRYAGTDFMRTESSVLYLLPSGQSGTYTLNAGTGASGTGSNQTRIQVDGAIDMGYQGRFTSCIWGPTVLASNGRYTHLRTSMWGGGSPYGNAEYIMGGYIITGYRYQGTANHRSIHQFHNWNGTMFNYTADNLIDGGGWTGAAHVYVDSTGYVTIRLDSQSSSYRMFMVDYVNYSIYSKVDSAITAITVSNSTAV